MESVFNEEHDGEARFLQRLRERELCVGVVGLGYVGLPLVVAFGEAGFSTIGFDLNEATIAKLGRGESHIGDVSSERVRDLRESRRFEATSDLSRLGECDAVLVCVPTPLTPARDPDLGAVRGAMSSIAQTLRAGQLVVLESTTYPGTTDEVARPILEAGGLRAGSDFFLAFSPERIDPGNAKFPIQKVPKVVGGYSPSCLTLAQSLYDCIVEQTVPVSSTQTAELTKLLENIFRSVNIALVNEMALLCDRMNIDVWEVIDAASTKPYGFTRFLPGPGLGGHCIPVDPFYLSWKARQLDFQTHFIELAGETNRAMPHYVVDKVARALNEQKQAVNGARIALLGMSYKPNIGDCRESPSLRVAELLLERGALLSYNDPFVSSVQIGETRLESQPLEDVLSADCVVLLTDHHDYPYARIAATTALVVDTRNAFKGVEPSRARIVKL